MYFPVVIGLELECSSLDFRLSSSHDTNVTMPQEDERYPTSGLFMEEPLHNSVLVLRYLLVLGSDRASLGPRASCPH